MGGRHHCGQQRRTRAASAPQAQLTLNTEARAPAPPSGTSKYNLRLHRSLAANTLMLTGSLTDNEQSGDTYFVCYVY